MTQAPQLTKIERVRAALAGAPLDHPPFTVWYHFGLQHAPAERTAQAHLEFFEVYDLDWLKAMNDYSYPMPPGVETLADARDLAKLAPLDVERTPLGGPLRVVEILVRELRGRALVVDTLFNAWNTLRRNVVKDAIGPLDRGAAGIFLSVPASEEFVTRDLALLEAIRSRSGFHVLHAHGARLHFEALLDYPVDAISWADREGGPALGEARALTKRALMGGIAQASFAYTSAAAIRGEIRDAIAQAGYQKLFLAPGCALATYTFPELIRAARDEERR